MQQKKTNGLDVVITKAQNKVSPQSKKRLQKFHILTSSEVIVYSYGNRHVYCDEF